MSRRKGKDAPRAAGPAATPEPAIYYKTPVTPEEAFQAIGRLRKEARDEIDRLIRFLDKTDDYVSRELEDSIDDNPHDEETDDNGEDSEDADPAEPSLGSVSNFAHSNQERWSDGSRCDLEQDDCDDEPSLGSHEVSPAGPISYFFAHSRDGSIDAEGDEHDGREPGEDDEPALGWNASMDQTDNGAGSMHSHECEPSLGSTSTINQEAWAFGLSNDREQGTTRNFTRKASPPAPSFCNVTWPDGSKVDLAGIASNVVTVDG